MNENKSPWTKKQLCNSASPHRKLKMPQIKITLLKKSIRVNTTPNQPKSKMWRINFEMVNIDGQHPKRQTNQTKWNTASRTTHRNNAQTVMKHHRTSSNMSTCKTKCKHVIKNANTSSKMHTRHHKCTHVIKNANMSKQNANMSNKNANTPKMPTHHQKCQHIKNKSK